MRGAARGEVAAGRAGRALHPPTQPARTTAREVATARGGRPPDAAGAGAGAPSLADGAAPEGLGEAPPAPLDPPNPHPRTDESAEAAADAESSAVLDALIQLDGRGAGAGGARAGGLPDALLPGPPTPAALPSWPRRAPPARSPDALDRAIDAAGAGLVRLGKALHLAHGAAWRGGALVVKMVARG